MQLGDIVKMARASIKANKLRARITITIIALGITALVGIITAIQGIEDSITMNFSRMGANTFNLTQKGFFGSMKKSKSGRRRVNNNTETKKINYNQALIFKSRFKFPALVSINSMVNQGAVVKSSIAKTNPNIWVMCADDNYLKVADLGMSFGRNFTNIETQSGRDVCLIGSTLATTLFSKNNNRAIGQSISVENKKYLVVGVLQTKGASMIDRTDNMVLIPINSARRQFDMTKNSYVVSIHVNDIKQMDIASSEAEGELRAIRKLASDVETDFEINKNDAIADKLKENLKYVRLMAVIIGVITLIGAAIGLMNIMLVAVVERTKEIGLSKALGATARTIRIQFLSESVIISFLGGIWGIVTGILLGNMVASSVGAVFRIPWDWILIAIIVCATVGILSGIYPAIKASKLNPINALRYE
jgi:putative ABC transport system permease protein